MEKILEAATSSGYPTEYLVARLMGRSTAFIKDWDLLIAGRTVEGVAPERARAYPGASREFMYIYFQMNSALREIFQPFFLFFELKGLFCCLRLKTKAGTEERIRAVLENSILSSVIKEALLRGSSVEAVLRTVERACPGLSGGGPPFRKKIPLDELYLKSGLREVERRLTEHWFERASQWRAHPVLSSFLAWLIDSRNIMTAYKYARWELRSKPGFISGGGIGEDRLKEAIKKDLPGIFSLAKEYVGEKGETGKAGPGELTTYLLRSLAKRSRWWGKVSPDIGFILDYLLRCRLQARSFSMIAETETLEGELVREELIF